MVDSAVDLDANEERAKIEMRDALEFEMMLANVSYDSNLKKKFLRNKFLITIKLILINHQDLPAT